MGDISKKRFIVNMKEKIARDIWRSPKQAWLSLRRGRAEREAGWQ